jgi:hypothetical protein
MQPKPQHLAPHANLRRRQPDHAEIPWAYAGQLSQGAAKELALAVTRHWDGQKGSDLLRFVRLEATKAEHMLYATRLADDVVLALVFDAETPFNTIKPRLDTRGGFRTV